MKAAVVLFAALIAGAAARGTPVRSFESGRIIGGEDAVSGEFPWQVSIQYGIPGAGEPFHMCGGSLIDSTHIVTAAHCLKGFDLRYLFILAGTHDLTQFSAGAQVGTIQRTAFHESYDEDNINNDIGLITLANALTFNDKVRPIAIPPPSYVAEGEVVNTGWGNTRNDGGENAPNTLQKVNLSVVDRATCTSRYNGINPVTESMVCAQANGKGACNGDSGGPLVADNMLVGVVSWGMVPCAQPAYPSVYANVAFLREWIDRQLA